MSSQPSQNQPTGQDFMQFAEEMTADFDERVSSLEDRYHQSTLNDAGRLAIVRRQRRLLQRYIENMKRRAEALRSRITMTRAGIAAMRSSDVDIRIVLLPPDETVESHEILQPPLSTARTIETEAELDILFEFATRLSDAALLNIAPASGSLWSSPPIPQPFEAQPQLIREQVLQPPLSIAWAIETEAELNMLFEHATRLSDAAPLNIAPAGGSLWSSPSLPQPFGAQLQQIREQENRIWVANASLPTRYGDPYDKLVGCGGGLVLTSDAAHPQCNACGRHHVQPTEPVEIPQIRDDRREFPSLNNRALIHARHARALACLDTSAMDEEITFRILQHPEQWGDLTQMVHLRLDWLRRILQANLASKSRDERFGHHPGQPWEGSDTESDAEHGDFWTGYVEVVYVRDSAPDQWEAADLEGQTTVVTAEQDWYYLGEEEVDLPDTHSE